MKKLILTFLFVVFIFSGCTENANDERLSVVSVSFPGYSFAKEIAKDNAEITMLLPTGSEAHSFEPTPKDIMKIQNADIFIYGGGESEAWVDEVLLSLDTKVKAIAMTELVPLLSEETKDLHHHSKDYDEHVWTSPQNAIIISEKIAAEMKICDQKNAEEYAKNEAEFINSLKALDNEFKAALKNSTGRDIVIGDRFPFLYLAKEYGISYVSAFPGCAGEAEPSAKTISELIKKVETENIPVVFYTEFSNQKVAKTICESTGAKPLMLHSCHNVSKEDFENGRSYTDLMYQNLKNLKEAWS